MNSLRQLLNYQPVIYHGEPWLILSGPGAWPSTSCADAIAVRLCDGHEDMINANNITRIALEADLRPLAKPITFQFHVMGLSIESLPQRWRIERLDLLHALTEDHGVWSGSIVEGTLYLLQMMGAHVSPE